MKGLSQGNSITILEKAIRFSTQFVVTFLLHRDAFKFIRKHRPWEGLYRYGWTARVLIVASIVIGFQFFSGFWDTIAKAVNEPQVIGAEMNGLFSNFSFEDSKWMLQGGKKYLVLIILEIVIFHFFQRTLELRTGRPPDRSFDAFLEAEKRMIKVAFITWIMENATLIALGIPIGLLGMDIIEQPVNFIIQFYFLGFAFIDNYHECFRLNIRESRQRTWQVSGIAIATGMVAYLFMFIPILGVLASSMLGAVTAVMAMDYFMPVTKGELEWYQQQRLIKRKSKKS